MHTPQWNEKKQYSDGNDNDAHQTAYRIEIEIWKLKTNLKSKITNGK